MRLYIAEKPSMGREIAACLTGPIQRKDGYLITKDGVVTWAFGHILRQAEPEEYDAKYKMWKAQDLPIIPKAWKMIIDDSSSKQFNIIKDLISKADEIIHAGDPDREGQLLIDEVLDYVGNTKPVKRILLNALDEESIKRANSDLRDNQDFANLKLSALARARADWLIGMNLSRAYTLAAQRSGKKGVLAIGRVKTPTLALVVRRERELQDFKPIDYYTIKGEFSKEDIAFTAQWKASDIQAGLDTEGRLIDLKIAEALINKFQTTQPPEAKVVDYQKKQKKDPQRLPFALSSLQVLAGKRFGYEPQLVLDTAQSLYEKKMTTYPRSDCEYLPLTQYNDSKTIIKNLSQIADGELASWAERADLSIKSRAWNDSKITAHHAIIPTKVRVDLSKLTIPERNIYTLIAQAYIAQFYPLHVYDQTKLELEFAGERFTASGRVVKEQGWKELYQAKSSSTSEEDNADNKESEQEESSGSAALPPLKKGALVDFIKANYDKKATKPPVRFTGATLLAAMKDIHKFVKDVEVKKKLKDIYGIGTEATRATIIEDLFKRKFLTTTGKKKYLVPTELAYMMIDALPDEMTYPDSTAMWEDYLHSLSEGNGTVQDFLQQQISFTTELCKKANSTVLASSDAVTCPRCKQGIMVKRKGKNGDFWGCSNYPNCKSTADDVDGKPQFRTYQPRNYSGNYGANTMEQNYSMPAGGGMISAWDLIRADSKSTGNTGARNWNSKPKTSAAPLEKAPVTKGKSQYLCKKCKEGSLRRIKGKNGWFWACSNYPHCTATYDDLDGKPNLE